LAASIHWRTRARSCGRTVAKKLVPCSAATRRVLLTNMMRAVSVKRSRRKKVRGEGGARTQSASQGLLGFEGSGEAVGEREPGVQRCG
jgi:hypothetical protein